MVTTIDCGYVQPEFAASFLLSDANEAAFVETNTTKAVPRILSELERQNLSPAQVRYIVITHVHLDHAGGAWALMRQCPNARLLAHPRAAPHMIDPSRLIASAKKVYGEETFERLYGSIEPIEAKRVRVMQDGEEIVFGTGKLRFIFTRGHANHHFCVFDSASSGIFTGDSFGIRYPYLQRSGLFIFPSTSPTDFDANEARGAIRKILGSGGKQAYLTHFGVEHDLKQASEQLISWLDESESVLNEAIHSERGDLDALCEEKLSRRFRRELDARGYGSDSQAWERISLDLKLNAAGLAYIARKSRKPTV